MAAAANLDNFKWPYLRNGSRSTYIARIARSSLRQHSFLVNFVFEIKGQNDILFEAGNFSPDITMMYHCDIIGIYSLMGNAYTHYTCNETVS